MITNAIVAICLIGIGLIIGLTIGFIMASKGI